MMTHPLKKYLEKHGLSQSAFGEKIGYDRITINRIVNRKGNFSMGLIEAVCTETGGEVSPSDFFEVSEQSA